MDPCEQEMGSEGVSQASAPDIGVPGRAKGLACFAANRTHPQMGNVKVKHLSASAEDAPE
jgi:hypothetical protein